MMCVWVVCCMNLLLFLMVSLVCFIKYGKCKLMLLVVLYFVDVKKF